MATSGVPPISRSLARLWGVISAACGIQAAWRFPTDAHRSMDQSAVPSSQHLPQNGCMELQDQVKVAGFREMWRPVYSKYRAFFECAFKLQGIVSEMITSPVHGQLPQIIRMVLEPQNVELDLEEAAGEFHRIIPEPI